MYGVRWGDVAQSDGEAGHQTWHLLINNARYDAFRRVYNSLPPCWCVPFSGAVGLFNKLL